MHGIKFLIIVFLSLSIVISCVRDITMDAEESPQVVVVCILDDGQEQILELSFTKGASLPEAPTLTDAIATLYDEGEKVGEFQRDGNGNWILDYSAIPGHNYRLEVQVPGYDLIHAEQQMPNDHAPVRCIEYTHFSGVIEPWAGWIMVPDPAGDWYSLQWPENEVYPDHETFYVIFPSSVPAWITAMNYNHETGHHEVATDICTDAVTTLDNVTGMTYEPFSTDVPNPYKLRNSYGKYEESFYSAHQMELYPVLTGKPSYKSFIRLPENNPQCFWISGNFTGDYCAKGVGEWGFADESEFDKGYILCITPSEDYDKYLQDTYYYMMIKESSDLSTIYLRDNVFTNIIGGLGIFGAQMSRKYPWARTYTYVDSGIPHEVSSTPDAYDDPRNI